MLIHIQVTMMKQEKVTKTCFLILILQLMKKTMLVGSTSSYGVKDASEKDTDDELFKPKGEGKKKSKAGINDHDINMDDCSKFMSSGSFKAGKREDLIESIRYRFVPLDRSKASLRTHPLDGTVGGDDEEHDDFEDLETGQKYEGVMLATLAIPARMMPWVLRNES